MAVSAEDLMFGDFSGLDLEEYQALFKDPLQSANVEFPWDDKHFVKNHCSGTTIDHDGISHPPIQSVLHERSNDRKVQQDPFCAKGVSSFSVPASTALNPVNKYVEPFSNEWSNQPSVYATSIKGGAFTDIQEHSSDGAVGSDSQNEDGSKKRRNKKRRDPDHYKRYYNRMETEGSFDSESGTNMESGSVKSDGYCGTANYVPPTVPNPQINFNLSQCTDPSNTRYIADEKSTERTSVWEPSVSVSANTEVITQTASSYVETARPEHFAHSGTDEGKANLLTTVESNKQDHVNASGNAGSGDQGQIPPDVVANSQAVPVIHISHSESTELDSVNAVERNGEPLAGDREEQASSQPTVARKTWASLFKGNSTASQGIYPVSHPSVAIHITSEVSGDGEGGEKGAVSLVSTDKDPHAKELGEHLSKVVSSHYPMNLQPRGLINTANWCYINSILQALSSCPPFYHLMRNLPLNDEDRKTSSTPMLDALYQFLNEFQELKGLTKRTSQDIRPGMAFEPTNVYQMLSIAQTSLAVKQGRQEDAEEFLSCLLNGLHDEMTSLIQSASGEEEHDEENKPNGVPVAVANGDVLNEQEEGEGGDEDEWEQVGPRNKTSITRRAQFSTSPLSNIFGGIMRSALHQHGSKESATLQPFFSLPLDIQSQEVWTVQNALDTLGNKESVHGFMSNKTKREVEAFRRITLEELPPVLTLHLKRFLYDKSGGCQKLMKKVEYGMELEISKDLISPNAKSRISFNQRIYKLFAVVYHTGKEASGGHYITDVYHVGTSSWLRCDDNVVKSIKATQVTKPMSTYIPYLLFYRRRDLLTKP